MAHSMQQEVLMELDRTIIAEIPNLLKTVEEAWQPADLLPVASDPTFIPDLTRLQQKAAALPEELLVVLVGDTITEEALPSYEGWLYRMQPAPLDPSSGWHRWIRGWTAEENRHGDVLNRYLYLSGRINMRALEISTQYLLSDGFDVGTANDPYRTFIYTSFQELATNISHRRVATLCKRNGNDELAKICALIAADEARHASAYRSFAEKIFEWDTEEMIIAFADMMKRNILMPAHLLREAGQAPAEAFTYFAEAAQRLGVYTTRDYIDILEDLLEGWKLAALMPATELGKRGQEYLLKLPARLARLEERRRPAQEIHQFSWINR